ncbi:UNVERIFIED_CONTAM: hypothetical protein FKN15_045173 [Acipenser sinensis]
MLAIILLSSDVLKVPRLAPPTLANPRRSAANCAESAKAGSSNPSKSPAVSSKRPPGQASPGNSARASSGNGEPASPGNGEPASPGDGEQASPGDGELASPGNGELASPGDRGPAALGSAGSEAPGGAGLAAVCDAAQGRSKHWGGDYKCGPSGGDGGRGAPGQEGGSRSSIEGHQLEASTRRKYSSQRPLMGFSLSGATLLGTGDNGRNIGTSLLDDDSGHSMLSPPWGAYKNSLHRGCGCSYSPLLSTGRALTITLVP